MIPVRQQKMHKRTPLLTMFQILEMMISSSVVSGVGKGVGDSEGLGVGVGTNTRIVAVG